MRRVLRGMRKIILIALTASAVVLLPCTLLSFWKPLAVVAYSDKHEGAFLGAKATNGDVCMLCHGMVRWLSPRRRVLRWGPHVRFYVAVVTEQRTFVTHEVTFTGPLYRVDKSFDPAGQSPASGTHACVEIGVNGFMMFIVLALYPALVFLRGPFRLWRRRRQGLCLSCGYNLTGNTSGTCSECGEKMGS